MVDTAINYRGGASEAILGELLEGRRDRFVVATKYTASRDSSDPNGAGNHRKNLVLSLESASELSIGFPTDFIAETETWVLGQAASAERTPLPTRHDSRAMGHQRRHPWRG